MLAGPVALLDDTGAVALKTPGGFLGHLVDRQAVDTSNPIAMGSPLNVRRVDCPAKRAVAVCAPMHDRQAAPVPGV